MSTIGLIVSGKIEANALLRHVENKKKLKLDTFDVYYFRLGESDVFLTICEKNMKSASQATALLIAKVSPQLLVSFGTAGALETDVHVADIVLGKSVSLIENGVFEQYLTLSSLPSETRKFLLEIIFRHRARLIFGTIITVNGEQTISNYNKIRFNNPVLDMETMGIAQIAASKKIQLISIRGVSHNLAKHSPNNIHTIIDYIWNYDKKLAIRKIILHPWLVFKLPEYFINKIKASHIVASTLFSMLRVLSFTSHDDDDDFYYQI